ncbi:PIG-L deacetylase family protein [Coralloluteibacterium stylophorae]|uniref:PIG-L family deacetylase n=1 Tax=Coralloluteibacterium stylophorae TaxID=1776034 RepID=A0A8J8AZ37_9GAMM|nr:PIG-L family deacetylase [Coralloluteibacterium stylophorae]MBS7457004.1 PIG-L family deacetylase [Coralloluteibacterium stylophorae]
MSAQRLIVGSGTSEDAWSGDGWLHGLPRADLDRLLPRGHRIVVVAPHPDDEVLGIGGTLAMLCAGAAREILTVAVTDGEASHSGAGAWTRERLRAARPLETESALAALGVPVQVSRLGVADGGIAAAEMELGERLATLLRPGDRVLTTWMLDGHPDHEATARAARRAAGHAGATTLEFPVWGWHWSRPGDGGLDAMRALRIEVEPAALARKRAALAAFRSQIEPDPLSGEGPILPPTALARFLRPFEVLLT